MCGNILMVKCLERLFDKFVAELAPNGGVKLCQGGSKFIEYGFLEPVLHFTITKTKLSGKLSADTINQIIRTDCYLSFKIVFSCHTTKEVCKC